MRTAFRRSLVVALAALLIVGCSSSSQKSAPSSATPTIRPSRSTITTAGAAAAAPVWLCQPGTAPDPCASGLDATVVTASGARSLQSASAATNSPFDCFYVYPTVSTESGPNADLTIQPAEMAAASV